MSRDITAEVLRAWPLPAVGDYSDKDRRGRVLIAAADVEVAGATVLAALAALRTGAGKLQVAAPAALTQALALALPEARVVPADRIAEFHARGDATVIGPGMLDETAAGELVLRLAEAEGPGMVVDAAALTGLAVDPRRARSCGGRLVLTPHAGEMAALSGLPREAVLADPLSTARRIAADLQAVVALKGAETHIVTPDGQAWRHASHTPGLGTSGSGDVLAGIVGGLLARGAAPAQAAAWGVFVHAQAGLRLSERVGRLGFLARELLDEIAPVLNELENG